MRPTVLVFDDDLVHHQAFLAHLQADFVFLPHADDAVAQVTALRPDLVLMDYSMNAALSGADATSLLREQLGWDLPIIAISSDERLNRVILRAGASAAIVKMALPEQFAAVAHGFL